MNQLISLSYSETTECISSLNVRVHSACDAVSDRHTQIPGITDRRAEIVKLYQSLS